MTAQPIRRLNSPGPVANAFLHSRAFIKAIIGPVGSGKTLTALQAGLRVAALQKGVADAHGVVRRKARIGVIRESYPNLEANTLKSWFNIVPEHEGKFGWRAPYVHHFSKVLRRDGEGRPVDILDVEYEFRAIGSHSVEEITRGWEVNAIIIDEYDLQPADLLSFLTGRVGRFSDLDASLVVDPQIILSLNMPYMGNHAYKLLIERELDLDPSEDPELAAALEGRPLLEVFIQPGGRKPDAENLHNLKGGRGYYVIQAATNRHIPGYVKRMVDNLPVPMQHGQPCYADFDYQDHVADDVEFEAWRTLTIGVDQGLFAAAVFTQRTIMRELRVLDEVVIWKEEGKALLKIGPTAFGKMVKAKLDERFRTATRVRVVCDPAAFAADDRADNEHDWILAFQRALGLRVHRAKTNSQGLRLEAVRKAQSERGGYLVDRRCKHLIGAHVGGYHYQKADKADGETRGNLQVDKNIYSHVADAEQYAAIDGEGVVNELRGKGRREGRTIVNVSDYPVLGG